MAPGSHGLPAAEAEIPVGDNLARFVRYLPDSSTRLIALGIRIFDWLSFPRRFSRADLKTRERLLQRMESSRFALRRELLMAMKALAMTNYCRDERVRIVVGEQSRCEVADADDAGGEPAPLADLVPAPDGEDCDIAIVGSGAGGAVAAATLAEAGLDVLVLEAGPYMTRQDYPTDPVDALGELYRDGGLTVATGRPSIPIPVGRAVGGTTVINSGTCFRAPDDVLAGWRDRFGIGWADALAGEYEEAERLLRVTPVDPERMGRNGQLVAEGAQRIGASGGPILRNAGSCTQCSSCPQGCRIDAKRGMHVSYLPRAVSAGARVRSGVEVRRIIFERGRATGIEGSASPPADAGDGQRRPYRVRARLGVIVAAGAFGTPELLLRSGLRHRAIGRNLRIHPAAWIGARFTQPVNGWEGVMQSYYVDQWHDMGLMLEATFTPLAYGAHWLPGTGTGHQERLSTFDRLGSNGVHLSDTSTGRVRLGPDGSLRVSYRLRREDADRLLFGIARAAEIWFAAGAEEVYPQVSGSPVLKPGGLARFESSRAKVRDLRLEAFHPMGTARMGLDPQTCVTGPDGSVHEIEGLHVIDGSLLPSSLGVNPMMTIIACASRISRDLASRIA
jgi:choline dehydrogenase-like flavoprotein